MATCLNDASHSLKPSALSPQSAARADATPIVAAATTANIDPFKYPRIRRSNLSSSIRNPASRQTGPNLGHAATLATNPPPKLFVGAYADPTIDRHVSPILPPRSLR